MLEIVELKSAWKMRLFQCALFHYVDRLTICTARRHASAVYAVIVRLSVCLSQVGVLLKRLNVGSRKQRRTIAQGL